ncbi:2-phospho-L-lactate guanylyltransferase [Kitasatospora phosalacinea]|uniref:Phosphoenolpyruvate guanylyltransferase n=1 Tax=Kitasatospora phosalacinea TaxID=2065 RepID=A0ABW6GVD7_9ACTN
MTEDTVRPAAVGPTAPVRTHPAGPGLRLGWSVVVPVKALTGAKSRLSALGPLRPRLALAFALDTVAAALACPLVGRVLVVTRDARAAAELRALGADVLDDEPGGGLNPALAHGAATAHRRHPRSPVTTLSADLPALRPAELARVLAAVPARGRAFLADAPGTGTVLLAGPPGEPLRPAFGPGSRDAHLAGGAAELLLPDAPSVRRDVDTPADLAAARLLGLGPATAALLGSPMLAPMQATAFTYDPTTRSGSVLLDDGTPVPFDAPAFDAGGLRLLRAGQRVRIRTAGEGAERRVVFLTLQTFPDPEAD